ncbi:MAG: DUF2000 domain-containing protein [bacterium]|nr:DUF2000 domain-containing protein [bacterium]
MYKSAIIINPDMPNGLLANTAACIASGLFLEGKDYVGESIEGSDVTYIPITKIPILILKPSNSPLSDLYEKAKKLGLKCMVFTKEAQTTTNYEEYTERVKGKSINDVQIVGIGIVGLEEKVNSITGNLAMLR